MADTRLFKVFYKTGKIRYLARQAVGPAAASSVKYGDYAFSKGRITKILATDAEATAGWTDVTNEFIKEDA